MPSSIDYKLQMTLLYWCSLVSTLDCPLPPPVTGGVCLATRVRYRQSCGIDIWSVLLAYYWHLSLGLLGGSLLLFLLLFYFFLPLRSDRGRLSRLLFFLSFSSFICFLYVAMVWKGKPASVTTGSRDRTYVRK